MVLVDSNVWIRHFRSSDAALLKHLDAGEVVCCDAVLGELLLGSGLSDEVRELLELLPQVQLASSGVIVAFIDAHPELKALGIGWADAQLLQACVRSKCRLFTHDRALRAAATRVRVRAV